MDIADEIKLRCVLDKTKPSFIVHVAALSNVEKCEIERDLAYKNNVLPVKILTEWAKENDATMLFISSDYVYDGGRGKFTEDDQALPVQYYGLTKLQGEDIVSKLKKHIILRPTVIYGWDLDGMNFFMQLFRKQKDKQEMKVPVDQINNPTFVNDLCELIVKILKTPDKYGIFVSTGPESMNRYEFGLQLCDSMGWDKELLKPVQTLEFGQLAKRPLNNSTSSEKVCRMFNFDFNDLKTNLEIIKNQIENNL
ncbi:MAG: hypothetical protein COU29_03950 [Candidatus Magasanikbacteria bacterium CG10_big_fil_rev_8_21_14_0_10_36_32]|uniref:dTDP-4-dehydrorhamnose reductase n=1 Tax=Candidatus Magasanikbacteria bacterium CG10_big_fil_rev_8_21_14_0_10_36_32 TaxID=1974646 RepID=A0A2M6W5Q3_9BACT|nr:MAG: hypothetical protein COU29_03950 [Candidatus Magasanikbacteria bacterium CG10_big_fil_rev_8_21_14_0_10_36_32]